jgi:hypothetical protein
MIQKYKIGDMADSGMIVMAWHPQTFLEYSAAQEKKSLDAKKIKLDKIWGEEWSEKPIYRLLLNEPTRQVSYEDFLFQTEYYNLKYYKPEFYKEVYEGIIPLMSILDIPEHLVKCQIVGDGGFDKTQIEEDKNGEV